MREKSKGGRSLLDLRANLASLTSVYTQSSGSTDSIFTRLTEGVVVNQSTNFQNNWTHFSVLFARLKYARKRILGIFDVDLHEKFSFYRFNFFTCYRRGCC